MKLVYTKDAIRDAGQQKVFIARHNREAAQRVSRQLRENLLKLKSFPHLGRKVEETDLGQARELVVGRYIARYLISPKTIYILRIWHQRESLLEK